MEYRWHRFIEALDPEHSGVVIDALQRYLQFDTFAGVIPHDAIDMFVGEERLKRLAQQAVNFCNKYRDTLIPMPQNMREEAIRAHLAGIINMPLPSPDLWHDSFKQLHEKNRSFYDNLSTAGRVEELLKDLEYADIIASSVSKYQAENTQAYTPTELIGWARTAVIFYNQNHERLQRYSAKEQRAIISQYLAGRSDIAW